VGDRFEDLKTCLRSLTDNQEQTSDVRHMQQRFWRANDPWTSGLKRKSTWPQPSVVA
jgi:hypothetical protein